MEPNQPLCGRGTAEEPAERFATLLQPVMRSARRYALTLTRNRDDADDLLQDALMSAWVKFSQLSDISKYRRWLFAIIRQEHWLRTRKVVRRTAMLQIVEYDEERNAAVPMLETSRSRRGLQMDLRSALAQLSEGERQTLLLFTLGGVTMRELSELQDCGLDCMKKRMERVREKARDFFNNPAKRPRGRGARADDPVVETMTLLDAIPEHTCFTAQTQLRIAV